MRIIVIRNVMTVVATLTGILFIVMATLIPEYAKLLLSVEVILLPAVYIVGYTHIEESIEQKYNTTLKEIWMAAQTLNANYYNEQMLRKKLEREHGKTSHK
ncbi:MAG: hypothetical protein ABIA93_01590 [Candidatus Woesearchaeota archaeon]